jgi:hypothetical protein
MIYTNTKPLTKAKKKPIAEREQYAKWCAQYGIDPTGKTRVSKKSTRTFKVQPLVPVPYVRETIRYPSRSTGADSSGGTLKPIPVYTGDKMLGIAQMHKSNAVPIFKSEDAIDIAHMRR